MPYSYGDEVTNTNPPEYQGPSESYDTISQQIADLMGKWKGGDWLETIRGKSPTSFISMLPYSQDQIWNYTNKLLGGSRAKERAGKFRTLGLDQVNRAATGVWHDTQAMEAGGGDRGSSFQAAREAKMRKALGGARSDVEMQALGYEDTLRGQDTAQAMNIIGALEGAVRGDNANQNAFANMVIQSMYPELQALGQEGQNLFGLLNAEQQQQLIEQGFNQWLYQMNQAGGVGAANNGVSIQDLISLWSGMGAPGIGGGGGGNSSINNQPNWNYPAPS